MTLEKYIVRSSNQTLPKKLIGKKVIVIWSTKHQRECYGTPEGIITGYDFDTGLYTVQHIESDGLQMLNSYAPEELSTSLLLRLVSKAQQNKIETILKIKRRVKENKKLYYMLGTGIGILSLYLLLA